MKILLTGSSSFTGMWFARELARAGHEVTATFRPQSVDAYSDGLRRSRVAIVAESCETEFGLAFGDDAFIDLIRGGGDFDALCHHGAEVTNYRSPDFDVSAAVRNNTHNVRQVMAALGESGARRFVLTGSVFEGGEGAGSDGLPHFSPYGLSKALTAEVIRYRAREAGLGLGKFVIPNPFGPHEEPRFTAYLMRTWRQGETPAVNTPAYVRDNIHVSLLAGAYVRFVQTLPDAPGFRRLSPSGYVETQGAFAERFAREIGRRLDLDCPLILNHQTEFPEPRVRLNTDLPCTQMLGWDESRAWDEVADYYREG